MIFYKAKEVLIKDFSKLVPEVRREIFIARYKEEYNEVCIPSAFTNYLFHYHSGNSLNTKLQSARVICGFLNYLINQVQLDEDSTFRALKENGLFAINHSHLAKYLNYLSNKSLSHNSYNTIKKKEDILVRFYYFLYSRKITNEDAKISKKLIDIEYRSKYDRRGKYVLISPFEENDIYTIRYPDKNKKLNRILKDMDQDVWELFIEYAEKYYPEIALGVSFQIMGGIRLGEVVNLLIESVELYKNKRHIRLDIQDRQHLLFRNRNINESKSQVKYPRSNQPVFDFNGRLFEVWDNHIKFLQSKPNIKDKQALFVDINGQAMTGDSYEKYFYKLKSDFLDFLSSNSHHALEKKLRDHKWGTHIGRHIFTNHLIKIGAVNTTDGKPSPTYLRVLRGDRSVQSSADYIDEKAIIESVINKINLIGNIVRTL